MRLRFLLSLTLTTLLVVSALPLQPVSAAPTIFNINRVVTCDTSALINFNTSVPTHAYIEYGLTAGYGSSTIDDPARYYKEQAIPITGLTASTTYHYRIVAIDGTSQTVSGDATFTTAANGDDCPAQPTLVDTRMPDMAGAVEIVVSSSSQFQSALNVSCAATGKRIVTVTAGLTITGPSIFCNKVDSNWIIVRSSAYASLIEGQRVTPSQTSSMFTLTTDSVGSDQAPVQTATSAHHWRIIGAEITINASAMADAPAGNSQSGLVRLGTGSETNESQWPHHIVIDRSYIHGLPLKNTTRGVYGNGTDWAVIDSYLDEFHNTGSDAQAILSGQGRRVKIVNNTLISAGENFMTGGVDHTVSPVTTPTDFEFTRNYVSWKQSWKSNDPGWDGKDWITKNHWETKTGARFLVYGNVFDKWWSSEQTGGSIAIKSSDNDKDPTVVSKDITWYRNWHRNLGTGFSINGSNWPDEESLDWTRNVWIIQNLLEINGDVWDNEDSGDSSEANVVRIGVSVVNVRNLTDVSTSSGSAVITSPTASFTSADVGFNAKIVQTSPGSGLIQTTVLSVQSSTQATLATNVTWSSSGTSSLGLFRLQYPDGFRLIHNTFTNANAAQSNRQIHAFAEVPTSDGKSENFVIQDNIFGYGQFGIKCDGTAEGNASLNAITNSATRTWTFNLIPGVSTNYPTSNTYVANFAAVQFVNFSSGIGGNYRLLATSPGWHAASDGIDVGVDMDALERATQYATTGNWLRAAVRATLGGKVTLSGKVGP
jgi:hypothetical protein